MLPMNAPIQNEFFDDLSERRGKQEVGHNPAWFLELGEEGAEILIPTAFEPDPNTHRDDYYYNAVTNTLYTKVVNRSIDGIKVANWKKASQ